MKISVDSFKGEAPRVSPRNLPPEMAQNATNARLQSGDLEAYRQFVQTKVLSAFTPSLPVKTIYKLNGAWLSWPQQVDVARGLIPGDASFFTFLTCPALYAVPQYTTYALATGGAEPYPVVTRPLGMPAPTAAPTLVVGVNPVASTAINVTDDGSNLAASWTVAGLLPGTREFTQEAGFGNPAPCYRLYENHETVWGYRDFGTVDSASTTFSSDFWFELGDGNHQCGFAIGNDAAGSGIRVQINTNAGDSLFQLGSGINWDDEWAATTLAHIGIMTSETWYTMVVTTNTNADGSTTAVAKVMNGVTLVASLTLKQSFAKGGFFGLTARSTNAQATRYDNIVVTGSGSLNPAVVVNTATSYVYTYRGANSWESAPSPASGTVLRPDGVSVTVTTPTTTPYDPLYGITTKVIYRAVSGASGTVYLLVDTLPLAQADYVDILDDSVISTPGTPLPSANWDLPPPTLQDIIALPNNCMAGFFRNQLCFSAQGYPHAWPVAFRLTTDTDIVSIRNIDNVVVVTTKAFVYTAAGNEPGTYSMSQPGEAQACVAKRGTVYVDGYGVVFPSPDGIQVCAGSAGNVRNATAGIFTKQQWEALNPSSMIAAVYDGVLFFWFDGTTPDSGYALDTKQGGFGLIRLSHHILASYVDPELDALYLVLDVNSEPVEALLPIASTAVTASPLTIFQFDAHAIDRIRVQWRGKLNLLPYETTFHFAKVEAQDFTNLVLRVYADGALIYTVRVISAAAFRIPGLTCYSSYELELVGTSRGRTAQLAQTVTELD